MSIPTGLSNGQVTVINGIISRDIRCLSIHDMPGKILNCKIDDNEKVDIVYQEKKIITINFKDICQIKK